MIFINIPYDGCHIGQINNKAYVQYLWQIKNIIYIITSCFKK